MSCIELYYLIGRLNKDINNKKKDLYEIRNTVTDKFAFCDGTLIVAMVTLQEPYFPKHVFSHVNLRNLVLFLEYAGIFLIDHT